ncbi:hypothetical protein [Nostoc sp. WHI]|uniref:hypothetical protein n=1 Tax=Nostoc sp. WHI TaxID=2650611 RepID=UPI0018C84FEB|nr:hypothetical protein [Nostoc sp. WHI]MBG1271125.1 hypothetical protein [Nostoc sp. WHI]
MTLYGYTIGRPNFYDPDTDGLCPVWRFPIPIPIPPSPSPWPITPQLIGNIRVPNIPNANLGGLGTNPITGRISAVNAPRLGDPDPQPSIRVSNIDAPFAPVISLPTRTPSNLRRFGFDSGADFGRDFSAAGQPIVLYNISGNQSSSNGVPVGSSLYKITTANPGTLSLVDSFGGATTAARTQGTQPTNPGKFADGLAIDNLNPGRTRALASDFTNTDETTGDTTRNNLYKVDLLTGQLSAPIVLRNSSGQPLNLNRDSGLAFTNLTGSTQRLLALLETGQVYEITGFQDELAAPGLSLGTPTGTSGAGFATARLLGTVNLPGAAAGTTDYEGFTIVNE